MELVLASASPWRKRLLETAGIRCRVEDPGVDESRFQGWGPVETARRRAAAKALAVAARLGPGPLVVGADQVVHLEGRAFSKPRNPQDHRAMLHAMRGRSHDLVTAVCLSAGQPQGGAAVREAFEETSRLVMRTDLTDAEIDAYVALGEASSCGGGYRVDGVGLQLFERLEGDWTNVVGLPVPRLLTALRRLGWRLDPAAG
ncbi:MAG: septum formation protein Maf [Deltaproteobacteria bacterium]|nr:septum formation protein Maf [Deltaproteobacteria bacterium]